jgi:diacylglycerol kinase family enzyme
MSQLENSPPVKGAKPGLARQLAAVLAIVCLLAALAAIAFAAVLGDAWRLPVVLVVDAAAIVGLWFGLSHRGAARLFGLVLAGVALLVVIAVTLAGDYRGVPLILAILLGLASGTAARYALRGGSKELRQAPLAGLRAPPPVHPVLIMNPKSGGGKAERFGLVEECRARGIEPVVLHPGDDLLQLASDAIARGADVIGMAGGDGSQALVATIASKHDIPHVCVPAGTRNHFALDLGLDREDVVGALDAFHNGVERRVDLARVNGRIFVNNASMGLYAKIVQSPEYRDAKLRTAAELLPDMLGPEARPFDLQFVGPDGNECPSAHLVLVSNNPYQLDHLSGRGTRARMDRGTLGLAAARIAGAREAVEFVALEAAGRVRSFRGWFEWEAPQFRVDSDAPVEIGIDGEALRMDPPLLFDSLPGALRVRIPQHAPGFAPAALSVRLTGSTIRDVLLTALGREAGSPPGDRDGLEVSREEGPDPARTG